MSEKKQKELRFTSSKARRVIARFDAGDVSSDGGLLLVREAPESVYQQYCKRGEMENKIKEQMMLYSDRTSAHLWWANQWRVLLSSLAYVLMDTIRRLALKGTELEKATVQTIRLKLVKIGCLFQRKSARYVIRLSAACPFKELFEHVVARLRPT